jgi:iron complex transport system ATP-binding protein
MDNLILLENVSLVRDQIPVLNDINWTVKRGEHWFILGNNGSGKTSLLEILTGYTWPQSGKVTVLGETFGHAFLPELRKRIGYVSPWIFRRISGQEKVERIVASGVSASAGFFGEVPLALSVRVDEKLKEIHSDELKGRLFGHLSTGQQLKVILGRALINDPEILILDEPFSGLDIGNRQYFYRMIEEIACSNRCSLILVTHHLEDIRGIFSHGMIIKNGRIFVKGNKEEVLNGGVIEAAFMERSD